LGLGKGLRGAALSFIKMKTKYSIIFFAAVILLLVCEYLFLTELMELHRLLILFLAAVGVISASCIAVLCYIRSAKDVA